MHRRIGRLGARSAAVASILLVVAGSPAGAKPPQDVTMTNDAWGASAGTAPDDAAVRAYRSAQPRLTAAEASKRVRHQAARATLLEAWAQRHADTFGGSWYDTDAGVMHIAATSGPVLKSLVAQATRAGVPAQGHLVEHSYRALSSIAETINTGRHASLGSAATGRAGVDAQQNRVVVSLPTPAYSRYRTLADGQPIVVKSADGAPRAIPTACTDRFSCAAPLTGGVAIWQTTQGNWDCSTGYTGRKADGSRWAVTAGHCTGLNAIWGHYGTAIGPVRYQNNPYDGGGGNDSALIRMDNAVWANAAGGYQYHGGVSGHRVDLDYAISSTSTIAVGDVVCFNAWHSDYGGSNCGTVDIESDADNHGLTRVRGYAVCGGDSGGSVLYYPSSNTRWGYGIISGSSDTACPPNAGNSYYSWFEPLPRAQAAWGGVTIETR
jgi:streptogrisin C